ncbi:uncharacterized protein BO66DRAFT_88776 [Aspergillus aculeatinus CBS 121060]|uniref:Uncharacterized protein n=1 Tax=Aspergillus aculeatinus CBS 121060 TaxID=1448322 RepID=A0ACD1H967_9EURO|nr:hypothetical protein BO66DRAFT_88776 [Aspergillus aculeatinus CBS 121060]RAH70127.1 hypothetical protein BO66DRAFT_88776 [Aspergillus aculeatinus CBS 121060]
MRYRYAQRPYIHGRQPRLDAKSDGGSLLGNGLEVGSELTTLLDSLLTGLDGTLKIALLELGGTEVVQVGDVLVQLPSLAVVLNSLIKLSLLVEIVTKLLLGIRGFLSLLLLEGLLILRLGLRGGLGLLLGSSGTSIGHRHILLSLLRSARGSSGLRRGSSKVHIDTQQHTHDLQEAGVADLLTDVVGVLLQALELGHEVGIGQQGSGLGVAGELLEKLRIVEHSTESSHGIARHTVGLGFGVDGPLDSVEAVLSLVVGGLQLQSLFVCVVGSHWIRDR